MSYHAGVARRPSTLKDLPLPPGAARRLGHGQLRAAFGGEHAAVSPRGDRVISADGPRCLVWHLAGGAPTPWTAEAPFRAVGFAEDGRRYLLLDGAELTIVDPADPEAPTCLPLGAAVLAGAITSDGARVVGACDDDRVRTWDAAGALLSARRVPTRGVRRLVVDRTGARCALVEETRARVVDLAPPEAVARAAFDAHHPLDAALSPDGARLALALPDGGLELRDAATGVALERHATQGWCGSVALDDDHLVHATLHAGGDVALRTAAGPRWSIALPSSAHRLVLAAGRVWAFTGAAVVALDLATGAELPLAPGPLGRVRRVHAAGERLLVHGDERGVLLFGPDGALERRLTAEHFMDAAPSPDGQRVALLGQQRLAVVRAADGVEEVARALAGCNASVAWSPDGARLVVGDYAGAARTLDARTLKERATLEACAGIVERLAFTPDGRLLITGQGYQPPRLWEARTGAPAGKLAWRVADVWGWALAGGDRLVTSHGTTLRVWSLPEGRLEREVPVGTGERRAKGLAVSPDGQRAAWSSWYEQAIHLVDLGPGEGSPPAVALEGHPGAGCEALTFTAEGRRLVSGATDGTVLEWDVAAATPVAPAPPPARAPRAKARRPRAPKAAAVERPASAALDLLLGGARPRGSRLALRKAGALALPDGRLVVADPHLAGEATPLELPPGRHAVTVCVQTYGSGEDRGEEPAAILVRFAAGRPVEWRAPFGARRGRALGPAVDSATLLLCGAARALALHEDGAELEALFPSLEARRVALGRRGWALVGPRESNALVVSTGSDGGYPAYLGRSRAGRPLVLALPIPR